LSPDIDTTVKPLYGHQEGAVVSYNPREPGRPSHSYHCYMMANLRLVLAARLRREISIRRNIPRRGCGSFSTAWRSSIGRGLCLQWYSRGVALGLCICHLELGGESQPT
jgi:hypothetical protein